MTGRRTRARAERHRAAQVPLSRNVRRRHLERQRGLDQFSTVSGGEQSSDPLHLECDGGLDLPAADALARPRDGDADEGTLDELDGDLMHHWLRMSSSLTTPRRARRPR